MEDKSKLIAMTLLALIGGNVSAAAANDAPAKFPTAV